MVLSRGRFMRPSPLFALWVSATLLLCTGCGLSTLPASVGSSSESDCGDCPNSQLLQPQVGREQVVHPVYASWALFPLGTEVAHAHKKWDANGLVRESTVTLRLLAKSESQVVLEEIRTSRGPSGQEAKETHTVRIPSALPKSAQGHEPFYPLCESAGRYEVEGKSIEVFLARSASFGSEGERRGETLVSPSIPGLVAKKTVRDPEGKNISEIRFIRFSIGL